MSQRSKKSTLAASFIVTVGAALGGCSPAQPEPEEPIMTRNPPMPTATVPTAEPEAEPTATSTPPETPPEQSELPNAPTDRPGRIDDYDGKCMWVAAREPIDCPPNTKCNPPAPEMFEVNCPEKELKDPPPGVSIITRADGTCVYFEDRPSPPCPPNTLCNPPPPVAHEVKCPPKSP